MAQIKIYAQRPFIDQNRQAISDAIHQAVMTALHYPEEKRFHRFISLDQADFIYPSDRSGHYTIIEISMFTGRTAEAKKQLIRQLFQNLKEQVALDPHNVEITISETPRENWGIRGLPGDELALNYKVTV